MAVGTTLTHQGAGVFTRHGPPAEAPSLPRSAWGGFQSRDGLLEGPCRPPQTQTHTPGQPEVEKTQLETSPGNVSAGFRPGGRGCAWGSSQGQPGSPAGPAKGFQKRAAPRAGEKLGVYPEGEPLEGNATSPEMRRKRKQEACQLGRPATQPLIKNTSLLALIETGQAGNDTKTRFLSLINRICCTEQISLNQKSQIPFSYKNHSFIFSTLPPIGQTEERRSKASLLFCFSTVSGGF